MKKIILLIILSLLFCIERNQTNLYDSHFSTFECFEIKNNMCLCEDFRRGYSVNCEDLPEKVKIIRKPMNYD